MFNPLKVFSSLPIPLFGLIPAIFFSLEGRADFSGDLFHPHRELYVTLAHTQVEDDVGPYLCPVKYGSTMWVEPCWERVVWKFVPTHKHGGFFIELKENDSSRGGPWWVMPRFLRKPHLSRWTVEDQARRGIYLGEEDERRQTFLVKRHPSSDSTQHTYTLNSMGSSKNVSIDLTSNTKVQANRENASYWEELLIEDASAWMGPGASQDLGWMGFL